MSRRGAMSALAVVTALAAAAPAAAQYPNPRLAVGDAQVHDPSLVARGVTPRYMLFSTHNQAHISTDRTAWLRLEGPLQPVPEWTRPYGNGGMWAPDVTFRDGRYWMYYTAATTSGSSMAIGLATSTTAEPRSWVDRGMVIDSNSQSAYNAIDPDLLVDPSGRWWLAFGNVSRGVHVVELDPSTGKVKSGVSPVKVATATDGAITAPALYHHDGHYYLFAAYGSCCPPLVGAGPPTQRIRVGRSSSPTGPYVDDAGTGMLSGGGKTVLAPHGDYAGPGGPNPVYDPADDSDLLVYHYYDRRLNYTSFLGINYMGWSASGWPYLP